MNVTGQLIDTLQAVLRQPTGGVVGAVDELLRIYAEHSLQLDWQADRCRLHFLADGSEVLIDKPLRKSVFRAVLARLATLCNQQRPGSVSPYGGQGELSLGGGVQSSLGVSFVNTPDEQRLSLWPIVANGAPYPR
jgi:hypothetical protein